MRRAAAPAAPSKALAVDPYFRVTAHAMLDAFLDAHPGTDSILIAADGAAGFNATSYPVGLSTKRGMAEALTTHCYGESPSEIVE